VTAKRPPRPGDVELAEAGAVTRDGLGGLLVVEEEQCKRPRPWPWARRVRRCCPNILRAWGWIGQRAAQDHRLRFDLGTLPQPPPLQINQRLMMTQRSAKRSGRGGGAAYPGQARHAHPVAVRQLLRGPVVRPLLRRRLRAGAGGEDDGLVLLERRTPALPFPSSIFIS
jgi:hypothetical protein